MVSCLKKYWTAEEKASPKHICYACDRPFECKGTTGDSKQLFSLCKCQQEILSCCCLSCGMKEKSVLTFYCSDDCWYDYAEYSDDDHDQNLEADFF